MKTKYTVSLELVKQMKEVGWKKETEFSWVNYGDVDKEGNPEVLLEYGNRKIPGSGWLPAPLATEILEELPGIEINLNKFSREYEIRYGDCSGINKVIKGKSLPNALAEMWFYLKKGKLL